MRCRRLCTMMCGGRPADPDAARYYLTSGDTIEAETEGRSVPVFQVPFPSSRCLKSRDPVLDSNKPSLPIPRTSCGLKFKFKFKSNFDFFIQHLAHPSQATSTRLRLRTFLERFLVKRKGTRQTFPALNHPSHSDPPPQATNADIEASPN